MTRTRTLWTVAACAAAAGAVFPAAASAEETDCTGALAAVTVDNLRVPEGSTCTLTGMIVEGTVKVETDATLQATDISVIGNVQAENADMVTVLDSDMGGSFQVKQGRGADLRESNVTGDVQLDEESEPLRVEDNDVGGSIQVVKNTGGVVISNNIVDGNLQCKENEPPPTGGGNEVHGNAEDQCAALAGGSPEAGPGGDDGPALLTGQSLRATSRGVVAVRLMCAGSRRCTGRVRLNSRGGRSAQAAATLGSARFAIAAGRTKSVHVRLSRRGRAALRRTGRVRVTLAVASRGHVSRRAVTVRR
jgi:hypothetical protein